MGAILAARQLAAQDMPRYRWENFTTADGLPDNRVYQRVRGRRSRLGGDR